MGALVERLDLTLMAEAHQFYLEDDGAGGDSGEVWNGSALENHFSAVPGLVAIGTGTQNRVPVAIEVWDGEPALDLEAHDHVGETSLELGSGTLLVSECQGDPRLAELTVAPGWYRVRIAFDRLDTSDEEDYKDSYRCQLWPAAQTQDRVLKWFGPWSPGAAPDNPYGLRVMTGARAWDERLKMRPVGKREAEGEPIAFLFQDDEGAYWEYGWHGKTGTDLIEVPASEVYRYEPHKPFRLGR
jgi:hypothetical protein